MSAARLPSRCQCAFASLAAAAIAGTSASARAQAVLGGGARAGRAGAGRVERGWNREPFPCVRRRAADALPLVQALQQSAGAPAPPPFAGAPAATQSLRDAPARGMR
jgi:hypothetical protein